jgi:hypothetical protein
MNFVLKVCSLGIMFLPSILQAAQVKSAYDIVTSQNKVAIHSIQDINAQDENGDTVLSTLVKKNWGIAATQFLIENRSDLDVNALNSAGQTVVDIAVELYMKGSKYDDKISSGAHIHMLTIVGAKLKQVHVWNNEPKIPNAFTAYQMFQNARVEAQKRENEQSAYEAGIAYQLQEHIPVKDVHHIVTDYAKMSLLEFIHFQKEQVSDNTVSNNSTKN